MLEDEYSEHEGADEFIPLQVPLSKGAPETAQSYDLCVVFPLSRSNKTHLMEISMDVHHIIQKIIACVGRKYMYMYDSVHGTHRYVLIRGSSSRLKQKAEQLQFVVELNEDNAYRYAFHGDKSNGIESIEIVQRPDVTDIRPFQYIFGRFVNDPEMEDLYIHKSVDDNKDKVLSPTEAAANITFRKDQTHIFKKTSRMQLLIRMLQDNIEKGGANINLRELANEGIVDAYYPLHQSKKERQALSKSFLKKCAPWEMPLDALCDYFGVKATYALAFMSHYAAWLLIPGILGVGAQISTIVLWDWNRIESVAFALVISIFSVLVFEFWKRKEKFLAMQWGTLDCNAVPLHNTRPAFRGTTIRSYIDGKEMLFFDSTHGSSKYVTVLFFFLLCAFAAAAVGGIYFIRRQYFNDWNSDLSQVGASVINAILILIMTAIGRLVARWLCDWENHRTDDEYEEAVVIKLFVFGFINSYTSFYYLAFGAKYIPGYLKIDSTDDDYDATQAVAINLAAILLVRMIIGNAIDLFFPWFVHKLRQFYHSKNKCRATCHACRWFWCSAMKKCCCRYFCCRIDLAYDEDTYEEDELYRSEMEKEIEKLDAKKKAKEMAILTGSINVDGNKVIGASSTAEEGKADSGDGDEVCAKIVKSSPEEEFYLTPYDQDGLADHYLEQVLVFGYITLFVAALPGAVFLGIICYLLEARGIIWSLLHRMQRPIPEDCEDIGLWRSAIELMVILAVCTNAGVSVFTMTYFEDYSDFNRMGIFIGFQYVVFVIQYLISIVIRDEPERVTIQRLRKQFLVSKLIEKKADDTHVDPHALL